MSPFGKHRPLIPKKRNVIFPPVSALGLKSRFLLSKKRKAIPQSQPQVLRALSAKACMHEPRENCWEGTGIWGTGDLGFNPSRCLLNQGHSSLPPPRPQCSKTGCCGLKPTRLARTNQSRHWRSPGGPSWAGPEPFACGAGTECVVHALCASQSENWPATHLPSSIQAPSTVLDTSCLHPKVKCVS